MMSENQSRRVLGEHKVVESIQSIADWVTKAKKVMSDIKSNKVDYNFYEITSDLEEDIARTDSDIEKDVLTGLLHSLNNAYSKIADKDDKEDIREDKEILVEDLDEAFYEKICRAYIDTVNLEWVTTNPENYDSIVHGYFAGDDVAEKYDYGAKVTPDNFKEVVYEDTDQESPVDTDYYEYETWEDFYEGYVKDEIAYDMNDIGIYDSVNDTWDFYISEEDLTKLGLWNEDMKSEFIGESKKVVEDYGKNVFNKVLSIEDNSGDTIMQFKVSNDGSLYGFDHCEVADEEDDLVRIQQVETFGYNLDESKKVESLSFDNIMDYRELIDGDNGDLVDTFFFDHKLTEEEDIAIIEAINKAKSDVEDYDNYTVMEYINKVVPIKQSLSAIYADLGPSSKKQIKY